MVLCEEVLQWITECGHNSSSSQTSSRRAANVEPIQHPDAILIGSQTAASATPHLTPLPAKTLLTINLQERSQGVSQEVSRVGRDWQLLEQLSHELGKNLEDGGGRSSPLSPSDLAGRRVCFVWLPLSALPLLVFDFLLCTC